MTRSGLHLIFVKRRLAEIGAPAVPTLISALTDEFVLSDEVLQLTSQPRVDCNSDDMPYNAEIILGRIGRPALLPLSELLDHPNSRIRVRAVSTLKRIGTLEAMEAVEKYEAAR